MRRDPFVRVPNRKAFVSGLCPTHTAHEERLGLLQRFIFKIDLGYGRQGKPKCLEIDGLPSLNEETRQGDVGVLKVRCDQNAERPGQLKR